MTPHVRPNTFQEERKRDGISCPSLLSENTDSTQNVTEMLAMHKGWSTFFYKKKSLKNVIRTKMFFFLLIKHLKTKTVEKS